MGRKKRRERAEAEPVAPQPAAVRNNLSTALLASALFGLAVSALLMFEYLGSSLVCAVGGGCDIVRGSSWASIAGVPVPIYGVAYFLVLVAVSAVPSLHDLRLPWALVGAAAGIGFLVIQAAIIGVLCQLCVFVDLAAIGAGVLAWLGREQPTPELSMVRGSVVAALAVLPVGISLAAISTSSGAPSSVPVTEAEVPVAVAREQKAGGEVTIVEYIDFECPACRFQHQVFKEVLAEVPYDVRMVYMHAPLTQHPDAEGAARAYICVEGSDQAAGLADAMFTANDVSVPAIEAAAEELGIDVAALRECMTSDETTARVARDLSLAEQVGVRSLPTFWIGRQKFVGTSDAVAVRSALDRWARVPADTE